MEDLVDTSCSHDLVLALEMASSSRLDSDPRVASKLTLLEISRHRPVELEVTMSLAFDMTPLSPVSKMYIYT